MTGRWLLPTRRRPHNLLRFFEALQKTNTTTPGTLLIDCYDYRDNQQDYDLVRDDWSIFITRYESQGDKVREYFKVYRSFTNALDWIGLIGDDQEPITPEWDQKLISKLDGKNLVSCNDDWAFHGDSRHPPGRIAGCMLWSMPLLQAVGYMFPPGLMHTRLDDVWEELDRHVKIRTVVPEVFIKHHHFRADPNVPYDETYKRGYEHYGHKDEAVFADWRDKGAMSYAIAMIKNLKRPSAAPMRPYAHDPEYQRDSTEYD